jgi:shikimate kinase
MNIVLIGYRGSGKSSIGRLLAQRLGLTFVDTDICIVEAAGGRTIREIFAAEGEAGFRDREIVAVAEVAMRDKQVIAVGGGAILQPANITALKSTGTVVWLQAEPEILHARIHADGATNASRPNLTAAGGLEEVRAILSQRTPLYQSCANKQLDVSTLSVAEAAEKLVSMLTA